MKDKNENLWRTFQTINEWIRFSDTKASLIISIYGIGITIIYSNSNDIFSALSKSTCLLVFIWICVGLCIIALLFAFLSLNPRIDNKNPSSIIYFGHIATNPSANAYKLKSESIFDNDDLVFDQLSEQVHTNSQIAWKKFKFVTYSLRIFFVNIVFILITLLIYFKII